MRIATAIAANRFCRSFSSMAATLAQTGRYFT
jgi:hypothetical protein